ncbi:MAG: esterase/lipase family protein [Baekduiaceae bacterium]
MRRYLLPLAAASLLCVPSAALAQPHRVESSFARAALNGLLRAGATPAGANLPCTLTAERPRPVVLVHGTAEAPIINWSGLAPYLANEGFCVHTVRYGMRFGIPGLADVRRSATELSSGVDAVLAKYPGVTQVDLVGHSQGGMMPRWYIKFLEGGAKVHRLVGISPSSHGSTIFGLTTLIHRLGLRSAVSLASPAIAQQLSGSSLLRDLNADDETPGDTLYDVIATKYDEVVTPFGSSRLEGASWWTVQDGCSRDLSEHLQITYSPRVLAKTANLLDSGTRPLPCRFVAPVGLG